MRIKTTLKNSIYGIASYILLGILGLLLRKVFINSLPVELLGYEGLFGNVFAILALADLGIDTVILYRLYQSFALSNWDDTNKLMSVYKIIYYLTGTTILILGTALLPFISYIITDNNIPWKVVYEYYILQLLTTASSFFLAYSRTLFTVGQKAYICTSIDTKITILFDTIKIVVLLIYKSYFAYLICRFLSNIIVNILITHKAKNTYPEYNPKGRVSFEEIKNLGIARDIKNGISGKIGGIIYSSTDSIVISKMIGISQVGVFSNYSLLQGYVCTAISKLLNPFQAAIGNYVYTENREDGIKLFRMFDAISFVMACVVSGCFFTLLNPFITLWLGGKYILGEEFVFVFSMNQYIGLNHQFLTYYRYVFGKYELDKVPFLLAAIVNLALSIVLCHFCGITGILIGTVVGHLLIWAGRTRVLFSEFLSGYITSYIWRQTARIALWLLEMLLLSFICSKISVTLVGLLIRLIISLIIPVLIGYIVFKRSEEMKTFLTYIKKTLQIIKGNNK